MNLNLFSKICCLITTFTESNAFLFLICILITGLIMWLIYNNWDQGEMLWSRKLSQVPSYAELSFIERLQLRDFHYQDHGACLYNGPTLEQHNWSGANANQSPINISTNLVDHNYFGTPLTWSNYDTLPTSILLANDGYTLLLRATYNHSVPLISGANLQGSFNIVEITFRWSWLGENGSEHTLNNSHFPLEMQCKHTSAQSGGDSNSSTLIISYMFQISNENPYIDVLIQHLVAVQQAGQAVEIPPFPLSYLMPAFYTRFYSYNGSLTEQFGQRGTEWFVFPEPLALGERQLDEFRQLCTFAGGRIRRNGRPVQGLNGRRVLLNEYRP